VAIKILFHYNKEAIKEIKCEMEVMSSCRHKNIVKLIGICDLNRKLAIVMEFCAKGTLFHVMHEQHFKFDWDIFFSFLKQALKGLLVMHNNVPLILHRDIKSLNILVTDNLQLKLTDFGLSRRTSDSNKSTFTSTKGTPLYMAPELFSMNSYTAASDIYSMGIVFWEMVTRVLTGKYKEPYAEFDLPKGSNSLLVLMYQVGSGRRPSVPNGTPYLLAELLNEVMRGEPTGRPSLQDFRSRVKESQKEYNNNKEQWNKLLQEEMV